MSADGKKKVAPLAGAGPAPSHEEIARRANEIWRARAGAPGSEVEDWLQAERELREEGKRRTGTGATGGGGGEGRGKRRGTHATT
jgi:hypothetical protein